MPNRNLFALAASCSIALVSAASTGCAASTPSDPNTQTQQPVDDSNSKKNNKCEIKSETLMIQSELIFGTDRLNQPPVTQAQFQNFVDTEITPRFPDGFSIIDVLGQFQTANGTIEKEPSKLLIVFNDGSKTPSDKLEALRNKYKQLFQQESVLRTDSPMCVAF